MDERLDIIEQRIQRLEERQSQDSQAVVNMVANALVALQDGQTSLEDLLRDDSQGGAKTPFPSERDPEWMPPPPA